MDRHAYACAADQQQQLWYVSRLLQAVGEWPYAWAIRGKSRRERMCSGDRPGGRLSARPQQGSASQRRRQRARTATEFEFEFE